MAASDSFGSVLEHLTRALHDEHQREVGDLGARIKELEFELERCRGPAPPKSDDPLTGGGCPGAREAGPAGGRQRGEEEEDAGPPEGPDLCRQDLRGQHHHPPPGPLQDPPSARTSVSSSEAYGAPAVYPNYLRRESPSVRSARRLDLAHADRAPSLEHAGSANSLISLIERLVRNTYFDAVFSALIALNVLAMAWEAQLLGVDVGADLGCQGQGHHRDACADGAAGLPRVFHLLGWIFGVIFTLEIVLRIIGLRYHFIYDTWNWMDLSIVILWFMSGLEQSIPVNPQLIRLARLAKLVRMVRLVRRMQGLDALYLMTTSCRGSCAILGWTSLLLLLVLVLNSLLLNQVLVEFYFRNAAYPLSERLEVYRYFGSFTTSLFSMFELTLANWPPISRILYENVSEWFILITIVHKLTIGFAVIGIINGVFIQETFKVAQLDDELMFRRAQRGERVHAEKMRRLVATADSSADGELDLDEFRGIFANPALQSWLASMELVPGDVDLLFRMMDDGNGTLTVDEMIRGVAKFKGSARNIDLHILLAEQQRLRALVSERLPCRTPTKSDRAAAGPPGGARRKGSHDVGCGAPQSTVNL